MNKAKFQPISFREVFPKEKYLPEIKDKPGFPIPNELLKFMDCLVSSSYKSNVKKGKVNHNESEIGFKILLSALTVRNVLDSSKSGSRAMSLNDISFYCLGYSKKSIQKGADWLVSKGLFSSRKGRCNQNEYWVNYTTATYDEISSDIARQLDDDISKEKIVFKGIRYLTTTENKKENDGKSTGDFTYIPFFLPRAKAKEKNGIVEWEYKRNSFFDSLDGNSLKVILQLAYLQNFNSAIMKDPTTRIKIYTLQNQCNVSRNKILKAIDYLKTGGFLRAYKVGRNARAYIFNFRSYRLAKVTKSLDKRRQSRAKRPIKIFSSFTVSGLFEKSSFTVSGNTNDPVLPSQDDYNKNLNLNKIKDSYNKDESNFQKEFLNPLQDLENFIQSKTKEAGQKELVSKEETRESLSSLSKPNQQKENFREEQESIITHKHRSIKSELLSDFRNLIIDYRTFQELNSFLDEKQKQKEELNSKAALIQLYKESKAVLV